MAAGGAVRLGGVGLGGLLLLMVLGYALGGDPLALLEPGGPAGAPGFGGPMGPAPAPPADDVEAQFVSVILADTEDTWSALFREEVGRDYVAPTLVLFSDAVQSACGMSSAAVGPFYCPGDQQVYIDLSFYRELASRFGAPGDFAQAYVIAHEVGHHVQNLLGVLGRPTGGMSANAQSIAQELQADCLAGVWGYYAAEQGMLEPGDAEEGLNAAAAIGDDRIQQQTTGRVSPESWTHGSSAQRVEALRRGLRTGRISACS